MGKLRINLANRSFGSGTDRVKIGSGQLWVKSIRIGYGFGSGEVRIRLQVGLIISGSGMDSVRLKFGSGQLRMVLQ